MMEPAELGIEQARRALSATSALMRPRSAISIRAKGHAIGRANRPYT